MGKIFYGWWIVIACFIMGMMKSGMIFYGFTAFFEPLVKEFGWSYAQVSFAVSLRGLETGIFGPVVGFLVDRFGSRKMLLYGVFTVGLGFLLLSQTRTLAMFYTSFVLLAFGAGGVASLVFLTAVAHWFQRKAGLAFGIVASGFGASGLIIPFIVLLIDAYTWRNAMVIIGLGMWALGFPLSFVIRDNPEKYGDSPDGIAPEESGPQKHLQEKGKDIPLAQVLKDRTFICLLILEALRMLVVSAVVLHIMPCLSSGGLPRSKAGMVAAGIPLCSIIGRFGFGWMGDVLSKRFVMIVTFVIMTCGMLALCYVHWTWMMLIAFLLLFSPGFGGGMVLRGAIVREYFGRKDFGKIAGIIQGIGALGGIIGPTLAGWGFDMLGNYDLVWLIFVALSGSCVGVSFGIRPHLKQLA